MKKTVLITCASHGIGRAIAIKLARDGFDIVVHYEKLAQEAQDTAEAVRLLGKEARTLSFSLKNQDEASAAIERDIAEHGAYYGVVYYTSYTRNLAFYQLFDQCEDWHENILENPDGLFHVVRPAVGAMSQQFPSGRVVAISAIAGLLGEYERRKLELVQAVRDLGDELASQQITVNCVAAGLIDDECQPQEENEPLLKEVIQKFIQSVPLDRTGTPEDVAEVVSFLMNVNCGYVTRQTIAVNGGYC